MTKIAVIYYSATGNVHQLAEAVADGAREMGAEVRLRRVAELAPDQAIDSNPAWRAHTDAVEHTVPLATLDDIDWCDGYALGTPSRFGNASAQLKQYLDSLGPLWARGALVDKCATTFTSSQNTHGGAEAVSLALFPVLCHFGAVIVPPGYTHDSVYGAGGNPHGTASTSGGTAHGRDRGGTCRGTSPGRSIGPHDGAGRWGEPPEACTTDIRSHLGRENEHATKHGEEATLPRVGGNRAHRNGAHGAGGMQH